MHTIHADLREGQRHDVTVEFVARRGVDCGDERVHRLLVADRAGTRFTLLVVPGRDQLFDLRTGAAYRVRGVLGCEPVPSPTRVTANCPDCGALLRPGRTVDAVDPAVAEAASRLDVETVFGVVDDATAVERPAESDIDRRPIDEAPPAPPDYVCTACGRHVGPDEPVGGGDDGNENARGVPTGDGPSRGE